MSKLTSVMLLVVVMFAILAHLCAAQSTFSTTNECKFCKTAVEMVASKYGK